MSWLACCVYLSVGSAWMAHNPPAPPGEYWLHNINQVENPYGIAEAGWEYPLTDGLSITVAVRHLSSLGIDWDSSCFCRQYGINTAEMRMRWFPFRK